MSKVSFEWDEDKDKLNEKKHGISFTQNNMPGGKLYLLVE